MLTGLTWPRGEPDLLLKILPTPGDRIVKLDKRMKGGLGSITERQLGEAWFRPELTRCGCR